MVQIASILYFVLCLGVIAFQVCIVAGAPWGHLTQGGRFDGALPKQGRIAALVSIGMMLCLGAAILSLGGYYPRWPVWTGWVALGVTVLSVVMNLATPSRPEHMLWGPVTVAMLGLALVVLFLG